MDAPLYSVGILRLAASIPNQRRLEQPHATVSRSSPVCGSRVTMDVCIDAEGRITDFGQEVHACALGQASAAILGQALPGETAASLRDAHTMLADWLRSDAPLPPELERRFPQLILFEPARAHTARHASICLAFDTAACAAELAAGQVGAQA